MTASDAGLIRPRTDGDYRIDRLVASRRRILEALVSEVERQGISVTAQDILRAMGQRVTGAAGWWLRYNLNFLADECYIDKVETCQRATWWAERDWALEAIA